MRRGFTLLEVIITTALVALFFTIMTYTTVQVAQATRRGTQASQEKLELIKVSEQLRWQLRGLYLPPEGAAAQAASATPSPSPEASPGASPAPSPGASPSPSPAKGAARPGFFEPGIPLVGQRTDKDRRDILIFLTNQPVHRRGAAEVGYRIEIEDDRAFLAYRQFPYRDPQGLHNPLDVQEAPWKPLSRDVVDMWFEYSQDGLVWRRTWEDSEAPRRIRVNLATRRGEKLIFVVTPGVTAGRW